MKKSDLAWKDIIRPYRSSFSEKDDDRFLGSLTVEPLSRGMGITLGNAMRRILLSSIESAAVTSLKIPGVQQEFSSIPGVLEDVIDIVINLKGLDVRLSGDPRGQKFMLEFQGPGGVFADSIRGGTNLEILNPHHKICTVTDDIQLSMEIGIERGVGYVPSEEMDTTSFGTILVDAQFSPIVNANYTVENITMGSESGMERLVLSVQTNGAISPQQAIARAGEILMDQASHFVEKKDTARDAQPDSDRAPDLAEESKNHPILYQTLEDVGLPVRCRNGLKSMGICFVGDLIQRTETQLKQTPNLGEKSVSEIKSFLALHNLFLGTPLPGWSVKDGTPCIQDSEDYLEKGDL